MLKLYTFGFSHFSEKARWALDLSELPYQEQKLIPGPHAITTLRLGGKSSVPLLVDGLQVVQGSGAILDYLEKAVPGLFNRTELAPDRISELEAMADDGIGRGVQSIFYGVLLEHRKALTDIWVTDGPSWARTFYTLTYSLLARQIRKSYKVNPAAIAQSKRKFRHTWAKFDALLARSPFLSGALPGRIDFVVAALSAPLCRPAHHPAKWVQYPDELESFCTEFHDTPTARHCVKLYQDYREHPK